MNTLSSSLDKVALLKESIKAAPQTAQLKQSWQDLEKLVADVSLEKAKWQEKLGSWTETLEVEEPEEGRRLVDQLKELKKSCDDDCKSLGKAVQPHKLWAKNHGVKCACTRQNE